MRKTHTQSADMKSDYAQVIILLEAQHDDGAREDALRYHKGELNEVIATAIWGEPKPSGPSGGPRALFWWDRGVGHSVAPDFVGDLNAAMMLLPAGWLVEAIGDDAEGLPGAMKIIGATVELTDGDHVVQAQAATRPLTVAIAMLKARAWAKGKANG